MLCEMFLRKLFLSYVRELLLAWGLANLPAGCTHSSEAKSQVLRRGTRPGLIKRWSENFGLCVYITQDSFWVTMDSKPDASAGDQILEARRPRVSNTGPRCAKEKVSCCGEPPELPRIGSQDHGPCLIAGCTDSGRGLGSVPGVSQELPAQRAWGRVCRLPCHVVAGWS